MIVWEWGVSGTLSLDFPVLAEEESVWGRRPWRGLSDALRLSAYSGPDCSRGELCSGRSDA